MMTPFFRSSRRFIAALFFALPLSATAQPTEKDHNNASSSHPRSPIYTLSTTTLPTEEEPGAWSSLHPLPPVYYIHEDLSVTLRICYNWSCATRETVFFSAEEMAYVKQEMAVCTGNSLHDRLQRLRIGIWQMEEMAERFQPLLANDAAINIQDQDLVGRMDCIDNSTNSTTFLHILRDLGQIPEWSIESPEVRNLLQFELVHWTAVVTDRADGRPWSIDAWYRPNGHLPFVMTLADWSQDKFGWESPQNAFNPYPDDSKLLCNTDLERPESRVAINRAAPAPDRKEAN